MKKQKAASKKNFFEIFATKVTKATGSTPVFIGAFAVVLGWAICGPFFDYSETWQLVINTGTTIITFLMVFLIQKTQNKDGLAVQMKLNELVASSCDASNRLVDVEDLTEEELEVLKKYYMKLALLSKKEDSLNISHSIDEAQENHEEKSKGKKSTDIKTAAKEAVSKTDKPKAKKPAQNTKPKKPDAVQMSKPKPKS